MNWILPVAFLLMAIVQAPFFEKYFYLADGLQARNSRITDHIDTKKLVHHPPLNSQNCKVFGGVDDNDAVAIGSAIGSAEDLFVDPLDDNLVYLAAGNSTSRARYFPPANRFDYANASPRDAFYVFNVAERHFTQLKLTNYLTEDLVLHGMYVRVDPKDREYRLLYFVNHPYSGSLISIFRHKVGSDTLKHVIDISDPLIHTPNAIAVVNDTSFYITNDHLFLNGPLRTWEDTKGPWKLSSVAHCHFNISNGRDTDCTIVSRGYSYANGLNFEPESNTLLVSDTNLGYVSVLKRHVDAKDLARTAILSTGSPLDNLSINKNGDFVLAAFPDLDKFWAKSADPTNKNLQSPIAAFMLRKSQGYQKPELIFYDSGALFSGLTSMSYIPTSKTLLGGSVTDNGLLVCSDVDLS